MTERNEDLIRDLLLRIEQLEFHTNGGYNLRDLAGSFSDDDTSDSTTYYHLQLLRDGGFLMFTENGKYMNGISWTGHDFLDSVRDPEIWRRTRKGALAAGGWTVDLLKDLAKGYAKQLIEEKTGITL